MESEKSVLSRNPLSDCAGIDPLTPSPSPSFPSAFKKRKSAPSTPSCCHSRHCVVYRRRHASDKGICFITPNHTSLPPIVSTLSQPLKASSVVGASDDDVSPPILVVYSRRYTSGKRKNREKVVAIPFSGTSMAKIFNNGEESNEDEVDDLPEGSAIPCRKSQKQHAASSEDVSNHTPVEDFIKKQKAYFGEIDEYKLPVEEVDSDTVEELE